jgi:hypothetical protein
MFIPARENNDQPLQYQYQTTQTFRNHPLQLIPVLAATSHPIPHFLEQRNDLRVKIHRKLETASAQPHNLKQSPIDPHVPPVDIVQPRLQHWACIQLLSECSALGLELFLTLPEHVFDVCHVSDELPLDLSCVWETPHLGHVAWEPVLGEGKC